MPEITKLPAIIIPVHNGAAFLSACLDALLPQLPLMAPVIAVENGSRDGSATMLARHYPQVQLLESPRALGFAGAVNAGIHATRKLTPAPSSIVLLNQDTVVDPGWLTALLQPLNTPGVGIVGSLARFPDGRIQHAGAELIWPRWYGRNLENNDTSYDTYASAFISGLATALRVTMLDQIGLFDEAFFPAYFEDADLCLRAVSAGWQLEMAQHARLVHNEGAVQAQSYAHAALIERGRMRLVLKHQPLELILGAFFEAEYAAAQAAATAGMAQVLRQAYMAALLALPDIAKARSLNITEQSNIAHMLVELRDLTSRHERHSRIVGLVGERVSGATGAEGRKPKLEALLQKAPDNDTSSEANALVASLLPPLSSLVTIVMLTWNGLAYTRACIESIRSHEAGVPFQLIVIDNGSTDGTREWLRAQPDLLLIENQSNLGFTRGNNQGMAAAAPHSDLLLLNNDTVIQQAGWLGRLHAAAYSRPDAGIVGCILLHTNGLLQHAGTFMPTNSYWGYQIGGGEAYVGQYSGMREVEGITGACMYIRRDVYNTIGGLDADYFSYFEDSDYCLKAHAAGFKTFCIGDVQITHHENTSSKVNNSDWRAMFSAGQQRFMAKWRNTLEQRYTRGLLWHSLFATPTGYGTSSREFVRELDRRNVDVRTACIFGTDYTEPPTGDPRVDQLRSRPKDLGLAQVVYSQADAFVKNSGRYRIGFTMLEADGLPEDWVTQANHMHEIWTPTQWGAEVFEASGITRPIHVVPLGFNPDYFHPKIHSKRISPRYTFLSVFDWIERKAPDVLIRAYMRAFKPDDDVLLLLKVSNHDPFFSVERQLQELVGSEATAPIALLLNKKIADTQMGSIYRSADCFVLPTRGEGWGMPTLEAMACGLPVISTDWGAQTAFLNETTGFPLRIRGLVPAQARSPYYGGLRWADPDEEHLIELMRYVYQNRELAQTRAMQAATLVHERWTWARATDVIMERLHNIQS